MYLIYLHRDHPDANISSWAEESHLSSYIVSMRSLELDRSSGTEPTVQGKTAVGVCVREPLSCDGNICKCCCICSKYSVFPVYVYWLKVKGFFVKSTGFSPPFFPYIHIKDTFPQLHTSTKWSLPCLENMPGPVVWFGKAVKIHPTDSLSLTLAGTVKHGE